MEIHDTKIMFSRLCWGAKELNSASIEGWGTLGVSGHVTSIPFVGEIICSSVDPPLRSQADIQVSA